MKVAFSLYWVPGKSPNIDIILKWGKYGRGYWILFFRVFMTSIFNYLGVRGKNLTGFIVESLRRKKKIFSVWGVIRGMI
jgi:hypothetical protein